MPRRHTRSEAEMEAQLDQLEPGSERYLVLQAARDFKASWVALGERLTEVRERGEYREWGYSTFEAYCRRELRIKNDTANKLTRSFSFIRDHEPSALNEPGRELPPLDVVDLLSRARERASLSEQDFDTIVEEAFAPESMPASRGDVIRRVREIDPQAFKAAPRAKATTAGDAELRKALLLAERLAELLEGTSLSEASRKCTTRIVGELRAQFEGSRQESA